MGTYPLLGGRINLLNLANCKQQLLLMGIILWASFGQMSIAVAAEEGCQKQELGLWSEATPFTLGTSIRIRVDSPSWTHFFLAFQQNGIDKFKIIFKRDRKIIKVNGLGVTLSVAEIPSSMIQYGQESTISFIKEGNNQQLVVGTSSVDDYSIELLHGADLSIMDSVTIFSDSNLSRRAKTTVNFCGLYNTEKNKQNSPTPKPESCPVQAPCPKPAPTTTPRPCPKPTPCPQPTPTTTPRLCPKPTPCPKPTLTTTPMPCPKPTPCPQTFLSTTPRPCHKPTPCPQPTPTATPRPCPIPTPAPCPTIIPYTGKKSMASENGDSIDEYSNNNTLIQRQLHPQKTILEEGWKKWVVYGLAVGCAVLCVTSIALAIALYKVKKQQPQTNLNKCPETVYFTQQSPSLVWNPPVGSNTFSPGNDEESKPLSPCLPNFYEGSNTHEASGDAVKPIETDKSSEWEPEENIYENVDSMFSDVGK